MTERKNMCKKTAKKKMSPAQILFCTLSASALLLTFIFSDSVIAAMEEGLKLCLHSLIPSLFPFMVLSELFVASGASSFAGRFFAPPISFVFGVSEEGASAVLLGFLCGFPVGQRCAVSLYKQGRISKGELEQLSMFVNNPSSGFLMSAVGASLFGSAKFGLLLLISQLLTASVVGICARFYFCGKKEEYFLFAPSQKENKKSVFSCFTSSVFDSTKSMLLICSFVLFFSAILGVLKILLSYLALPSVWRTAVLGFFEISNGVALASSLPMKLAIPLCASVCAWSGVSVHMQLCAACSDVKLSYKPYFLGKLASMLISPCVLLLLVRCFGKHLDFSKAGSISSYLPFEFTPFSIGVLSAFTLLSLALALRFKSVVTGGK